jgi:peptide/nickel transport system substrate-binding protein
MDPKWVRVIAIVVVVGVVVSAVGVYSYVSNKSSGCSLSSKNPLVFDQAEQPDSFDPAAAYTAPGWGAVQQVYQGLVMYNGSSDTQASGELAKNWSESADGFHWNFTLWPGEHFSNGDPINAYVLWFSFYRGLVINQPIDILVEENFYAPNVSYYSPLSAIQAANASLASMENNFTSLGSITQPSAPMRDFMGAANQSFRVLNNLTIQVNVGFGYLGPIPYTYLLDQMAMPPFTAVDPLLVAANGGVQPGTPNSWMSGNMLGSGPYVLSFFNPSTGYTLAPNPDYWATTLAAQEPWNNVIQPARSSIEISYQGDPALDYENLKSGAAASASFAYLGPSEITQLQGTSCVTVQPLPPVYGSTTFSGWIYMDQNTPPFNNLSVRAAVAHAIDYSTIISAAYGGFAQQWVGPVPPGYPDYNPGGLAPYSYNLALAKQEVNNSPWPLSQGGYSKMTGTTLNFEYINVGTVLDDVALLIQSELAPIGINLNLVGLNLNQLAVEQSIDPNTGACTSTESTNGGPFYIGEDFYTADYVAPDDATQALATSFAGFNVCQSEYSNATVDNLVVTAAGEHNATNASQDYAQMTQIMYNNYSDIWLVVPTAFAVYNPLLAGFPSNPMGAGLPYVMVMNTEYAT